MIDHPLVVLLESNSPSEPEPKADLLANSDPLLIELEYHSAATWRKDHLSRAPLVLQLVQFRPRFLSDEFVVPRPTIGVARFFYTLDGDLRVIVVRFQGSRSLNSGLTSS